MFTAPSSSARIEESGLWHHSWRSNRRPNRSKTPGLLDQLWFLLAQKVKPARLVEQGEDFMLDIDAFEKIFAPMARGACNSYGLIFWACPKMAVFLYHPKIAIVFRETISLGAHHLATPNIARYRKTKASMGKKHSSGVHVAGQEVPSCGSCLLCEVCSEKVM